MSSGFTPPNLRASSSCDAFWFACSSALSADEACVWTPSCTIAVSGVPEAVPSAVTVTVRSGPFVPVPPPEPPDPPLPPDTVVVVACASAGPGPSSTTATTATAAVPAASAATNAHTQRAPIAHPPCRWALDGAIRQSVPAWQAEVVALPLQPPIKPMLAKLTTAMPAGDGWLYEPKWDGFRCIV